jgi:NCS2 family nucleobase:cation symporter-2
MGVATAATRRRLFPLQDWRRADKPLERPAQIAFALGEAPPAAQTAALVVQQVAIQAIYLILPGIVGAQYGLIALDIVNFLCLSVAAAGVAGLLQALARGPVGSGYPVASIPSPVFVAVYLLAAPGANLVVAGTMAVAAGIGGATLALLLRRLQAIVPTEVAGVVVFLIGVSLLPRAFSVAAADLAVPGFAQGELALLTLGVMIAVALKGGAFARFAVLVGAALGTAAALLLDIGVHPDTLLLQAAPWFALPRLELPAVAAFDAALLPAFGIALLASFASWTGDLVAFQRAADGGWRQPDTPPIRRGLVAQSLAVSAAGLIGGMVPSTSSACVGLAIATRTLARRVAVAGAVVLLALACCPKAMALVALLPRPVEAAMLGYVCCFMLAAGCQLMTSRMLDMRRTFTVGLGLAFGIGALLNVPGLPPLLDRLLDSPVTAGAALAIALNLATAPLVARRAEFVLQTGPAMPTEIDDRMAALGGAWGARPETMRNLGHALLELGEVLARHGVAQASVRLRHVDGQVRAAIGWEGVTLPAPAARPEARDLDGPGEAQDAFSLWLATRHALEIGRREVPGGWEMRLAFQD